MVIFLDGEDRCSKDTLIEKLRSVIVNPKIQVMHESKPPRDVDYLNWATRHYVFMLRRRVHFRDGTSLSISYRRCIPDFAHGYIRKTVRTNKRIVTKTVIGNHIFYR